MGNCLSEKFYKPRNDILSRGGKKYSYVLTVKAETVESQIYEEDYVGKKV